MPPDLGMDSQQGNLREADDYTARTDPASNTGGRDLIGLGTAVADRAREDRAAR